MGVVVGVRIRMLRGVVAVHRRLGRVGHCKKLWWEMSWRKGLGRPKVYGQWQKASMRRKATISAERGGNLNEITFPLRGSSVKCGIAG